MKQLAQNKHSVQLKLNTVIEDQGEKERTIETYTGSLFSKGKRDVLIYEEDLGDGHIVKNLITIQQDKVSIKRSGAVSMNQQFLLNQKTETHYKHPHGAFHMETRTSSLIYDVLEETKQGSLKIKYTVKLNGMDERQHSLILTYKKENF